MVSKQLWTQHCLILQGKCLLLFLDDEVLLRLLFPKIICSLYPSGMNQKLFFLQCPPGLFSSSISSNYVCHRWIYFCQTSSSHLLCHLPQRRQCTMKNTAENNHTSAQDFTSNWWQNLENMNWLLGLSKGNLKFKILKLTKNIISITTCLTSRLTRSSSPSWCFYKGFQPHNFIIISEITNI